MSATPPTISLACAKPEGAFPAPCSAGPPPRDVSGVDNKTYFIGVRRVQLGGLKELAEPIRCELENEAKDEQPKAYTPVVVDRIAKPRPNRSIRIINDPPSNV